MYLFGEAMLADQLTNHSWANTGFAVLAPKQQFQESKGSDAALFIENKRTYYESHRMQLRISQYNYHIRIAKLRERNGSIGCFQAKANLPVNTCRNSRTSGNSIYLSTTLIRSTAALPYTTSR
jgi:hypothetical protein